MQKFLALPRYPFNRIIIEDAPEQSGIYGLFEGDELIYIGAADSIRDCLRRHQDGALGVCTLKATRYTWEISVWPAFRESEVLSAFQERIGVGPRCQGKAA